MAPSASEQPAKFRLMYVGRSSLHIELAYGKRLSRLIDEGFEVHVLASDDGGFAHLAGRGVLCKPIPVGRKLNVAGVLGAFFIVQAYFLQKRPVLVHAFDDVLAWIGAFGAAQAAVDAIFVTVQRHVFVPDPVRLELDTVLPVPPRLLEGLEALLNNTVDSQIRHSLYRAYGYLGEVVDKYLVINEHDFEALQDLEIVPEHTLEMLLGADGVALDVFDVDDQDFPSPAQARIQLNVPDHWRHVLGYVGPFSLPRGGADLIECVQQISQTHPAAGWLIGVDDGASTTLLNRLARLERRGKVKVIERPEDLALFYRTLDAYVLASYREGAPTRLMEAAVCGVGAIAYNLPATQSAIEHGQTGELIPLGAVDRLVEAVRRGLDDPRRFKNYGSRARPHALRAFNRQHVEDQVFRMYDTVLEVKLEGGGRR